MKYAIFSKGDKKSVSLKIKIINELKIIQDQMNPDIVITLGGDGTFLKCVNRFKNAIFVPINTGNIGFYSTFDVNNIDKIIKMINENIFKYKSLDILKAEIKAHDMKTKYYALNEITCISIPRTLDLNVYINDQFFERFRSTGICISTPTGSTGYNKSLNGPIIDNNLSVLVFSKIAPINSSLNRCIKNSLVLDKKTKITIKCERTKYKTIYFTYDNYSYQIENFNELSCVLIEKGVKVMYDNDLDFFKKVKKSFLM